MSVYYEFKDITFYLEPVNKGKEYEQELRSPIEMDRFTDSIMNEVNKKHMLTSLAGTKDIEGVTVEKGEGLTLQFLKDGELLDTYKLKAYANTEDAAESLKLPNGDGFEELQGYDWEDFDRLEQGAKRLVEAGFNNPYSEEAVQAFQEMDFAQNIDGLTTPDENLAQ